MADFLPDFFLTLLCLEPRQPASQPLYNHVSQAATHSGLPLLTKSHTSESSNRCTAACQSRFFYVLSVFVFTLRLARAPATLLPSRKRHLETICPPRNEKTKIRGCLGEKKGRKKKPVLKCSNEYFRHKGPLSLPAFAWLSPPNSPFKVK